MPAWVQIVVALGGLLGLGAGVGSPIFIRAQLKKFRADANVSDATAADLIQKSATALLQPAVERAVQLEKDLASANKRAFELTVQLSTAQAEVADLRNQVDKMSKDLVSKSAELEELKRRYGGTLSDEHH